MIVLHLTEEEIRVALQSAVDHQSIESITSLLVVTGERRRDEHEAQRSAIVAGITDEISFARRELQKVLNDGGRSPC